MLSSSALVDSEPPPLPPPPFKALATSSNSSSVAADFAAAPPSAFSYSPSLLIIAAILAFVVIASATIHLLLRLLSHRASHSLPLIHPRSSSASASVASTSSQAPERAQEKEREAQIAALPVFTLASAAPKSSGDCAVCLSSFRPHDALRLLPACRHAFHAACVDAWLRSTPSCPLCRASIVVPAPPPPPPLPAAAAQRETEESERSESFRVEIGSVSRRRSSAGVTPADAPPHGRSYSLGSAFDYLVEEEVEAVVARALRRPSTKEQKPEANDGGAGAPAPPGVEVAEAVGERGGSWLRDYVDRLASASSSFSSLRFSSRRFDAAAVSGGDSWDFEANQIRTAAAAAEEGGYSALYRWLIGLSS